MDGSGKGVLLAMSGGVDSSVAAGLLVRAGYNVTGVFMCLGTVEGAESGCCSPADAADARRVAGALGVDLHVVRMADAFEQIVDYFAEEYAAGRTPNPCIHCNTRLKFGRLVDLADQLGIDYVATGHYARRIDRDNRPAIARAVDVAKDQSYALFGIPAERLGRVLLPVGELADKSATREIARELGLTVADKPDSQEICFVADDDYASILADRAPRALQPGRIVDADGNVLGRHDGYGRFTIGQRRGLGVAGGVPLYVTAIDPDTGDVTIGPRDQAAGDRLIARRANWHIAAPTEPFRAIVQIRYNHRGEPAAVRPIDAETFEVEFNAPVHAITPGQAAVIYDANTVLGGGWIDRD